MDLSTALTFISKQQIPTGYKIPSSPLTSVVRRLSSDTEALNTIPKKHAKALAAQITLDMLDMDIAEDGATPQQIYHIQGQRAYATRLLTILRYLVAEKSQE